MSIIDLIVVYYRHTTDTTPAVLDSSCQLIAFNASVAQALREAVANGSTIDATGLVVAQTHALLLRRIHRDVALEFLKEWECAVSFAVMKERSIREALALDHHFAINIAGGSSDIIIRGGITEC